MFGCFEGKRIKRLLNIKACKLYFCRTFNCNRAIRLNFIIFIASASYCLGRLNGDCWFLYTLNHAENCNLIGNNQPDQTLEILMSDLSPEAMSHYILTDKNGVVMTTESVTEVGFALFHFIRCSQRVSKAF